MVFLYSKWMSLPLSTKALISKQFGFAKVGSTHVQDNRVISDGYKIDDVERALNIDKIQEYLGTNEKDFGKLWDMMIAKIGEGEVVTIASEVKPEVSTQPVSLPKEDTVEPPKKRGRKSKK